MHSCLCLGGSESGQNWTITRQLAGDLLLYLDRNCRVTEAPSVIPDPWLVFASSPVDNSGKRQLTLGL
jgi:hypothetical protein